MPDDTRLWAAFSKSAAEPGGDVFIDVDEIIKTLRSGIRGKSAAGWNALAVTLAIPRASGIIAALLKNSPSNSRKPQEANHGIGSASRCPRSRGRKRLRRCRFQRQQHGTDPGDHGGGRRNRFAGDHAGITRCSILFAGRLSASPDAGGRRTVSAHSHRHASGPRQQSRRPASRRSRTASPP